MPSVVPLQSVVAEIRQCFHLFKAYADRLHEPLGISGAMRAVLEALARSGPATVPDIARKKSVARQHIQTIVDELAQLKLVESRENPRHRRSALIALTRKGEALFASIDAREGPIWERLAAGIDPRKAALAAQTLASLRKSVEDELFQLERKGDSK
jgi:DNA-binding MarR family transcriptional regulator